MNVKKTGLLAISIPLNMVLGLLCTYILSPVVFSEWQSLSIATFNAKGLPNRLWIAYFNYVFIGTSIVTLCVLLFLNTKRSFIKNTGIFLIGISGFNYFLLGFISYHPSNEYEFNIVVLIITFVILSFSTGIVTLAVSDFVLAQDRAHKYFSFFVAFFILLESIISPIIFNNTGIQANISWFLYFLWFGVTGYKLRRL